MANSASTAVQQIQVVADQAFDRLATPCSLPSDEARPVLALGDVAGMAEAAHSGGLTAHARCGRRPRRVWSAGPRSRSQAERAAQGGLLFRRVPPWAIRFGERADGVEQLDDRARPTMGHDQRRWLLVLRLRVDEVNGHSVDLGAVNCSRFVQPRLASSASRNRLPKTTASSWIIPNCTPCRPIGHELLGGQARLDEYNVRKSSSIFVGNVDVETPQLSMLAVRHGAPPRLGGTFETAPGEGSSASPAPRELPVISAPRPLWPSPATHICSDDFGPGTLTPDRSNEMTDVTVTNRRVDSSANEDLTTLARHGADAFGYKANLRIDRKLAQLLRLRVSQINNCTYCLNLHHEAAPRRRRPPTGNRHAHRVETDFHDDAALRRPRLHRGDHSGR